MTTALALNATATLINGQGLGPNQDLLQAISEFQSQPAVQSVYDIFNTISASLDSNLQLSLYNAVVCIGNTSPRRYLLDMYIPGITPEISYGGTISSYGNYGNVALSATDSNVAIFTSTLANQAALAFGSGSDVTKIQRFANVFQVASGYASSTFETAASIYMLTGKTYAQSGISYTGPVDLATNGINNTAPVLSNTVANFGTMYDVQNLKTFGNTYIFGQNLINQGLGSYGNLSAQLIATGLDTSDLTKSPTPTTTTTQVATVNPVQTFVGEIELPGLENVSTTTVVTGNSEDVVLSIYKSIKGNDLESIVVATAVSTPATLTTLAEYLDFNKVIDASVRTKLKDFGVTDFTTLGNFIHQKIGQGTFKSWADIVTFLSSIEAPALTHLPTGATSTALYSSTISTIGSSLGTSNASGPLGNFILTDFLGAVAGMPYADSIASITKNYGSFISPVYTSLQNLKSAIVSAQATLVPGTPESSPGAGDGTSATFNISGVPPAVAAVTTALNSLTGTAVAECDQIATTIQQKLHKEIQSCAKAGVSFDTGSTSTLSAFAQTFNILASDKDHNQTYQFFANLILDNASGDTLKASIAETINQSQLIQKGIISHNDPDPSGAISQSRLQNIPLTTYLSQNK